MFEISCPPSQSILLSQIRNHWRTFLFLFLLFTGSFYIRVGYINGTAMINPIRADAMMYAIIAYDLAEQGTYYTDKYSTEIQADLNTRDPGYPFFLAPVAKASASLKQFFYTTVFIQSVLGAITVVMSYLLARFFIGPIWSAVVSILTMLSPQLISLTNYVLTETLFTFLLQTAILLYLFSLLKRSSWLLAFSGLFFGLSMCVRSVLQLFPFALVVLTYYFFRHERKAAVRKSIILLMTSFVFFVPWKIWSHYELQGKETPSLLKDVIYVGSYIDLTYKGEVPEGKPRYGKAMPYRDDPNYYNVLNKGYGAIFKEIGRRFGENPLDYTRWYLMEKPAMFWSWALLGGEISEYPTLYSWYDNNRIMNLTKKIMRFLHPIIIILMHMGALLFVLRRKDYSETQFFMMGTILMLIFYFFSIHTILVPVPRYALPLRPLVYFLAVFTIACLLGKSVGKKLPVEPVSR